jgi:hypothetical protein
MKTLDASNISVEQSPDTMTVTLDNGQPYHDVAFTQMFPHSDPVHYLSVRARQGTDYVEIGIIKDLESMPVDLRQLILDDIRRRYFLPLIIEIASIRTASGTDTWIVETDRGPKTFTVRERSENVTSTDLGVVMITDTDKCRYKIADFRALPVKSRMLLEKVLM